METQNQPHERKGLLKRIFSSSPTNPEHVNGGIPFEADVKEMEKKLLEERKKIEEMRVLDPYMVRVEDGLVKVLCQSKEDPRVRTYLEYDIQTGKEKSFEDFDLEYSELYAKHEALNKKLKHSNLSDLDKITSNITVYRANSGVVSSNIGKKLKIVDTGQPEKYLNYPYFAGHRDSLCLRIMAYNMTKNGDKVDMITDFGFFDVRGDIWCMGTPVRIIESEGGKDDN